MSAPHPPAGPGPTQRIAPAARPLLAPRSRRHEIKICHGEACPRCASSETRPWGGFSGRRRFRCLGCRRTFSTFTGTPLHYLKQPQQWPRFTRCFDDRASIRRCASRLRVHPSTAFRWRHRLLADWVLRDDTVLDGRIYLGQAWFAHSEKGRVPKGRISRRRGYPYPHRIPADLRVQVAYAWQREDRTLAEPSRPGAAHPLFPVLALSPRFRAVDALLPGPLPIPGIQELVGPTVRVVRSWQDPLRGQPSTQMGYRLHRWFRPLHGVATRYLNHYLRWFRSDLADGHPTLDQPPRRLLRWMTAADKWPWAVRRRDSAVGSAGPEAGHPQATIPANRTRGSPAVMGWGC